MTETCQDLTQTALQRIFAIFSRFVGHVLAELQKNPGGKGANSNPVQKFQQFSGEDGKPNLQIFVCCQLVVRGPAAILFISRDTCSDSLAKQFRACLNGGGGIARLLRDTLRNGISHRFACAKLSSKGGVSHHFGGALTSLKKFCAIWCLAAIVSQYRAIWGH